MSSLLTVTSPFQPPTPFYLPQSMLTAGPATGSDGYTHDTDFIAGGDHRHAQAYMHSATSHLHPAWDTTELAMFMNGSSAKHSARLSPQAAWQSLEKQTPRRWTTSSDPAFTSPPTTMQVKNEVVQSE